MSRWSVVLKNPYTMPLSKTCNVFKFADITNVQSCIFINNCFNKGYFSTFNENFESVSTTHSYNARSARSGLSFVLSFSLDRFGRKLIVHSAPRTWNYLEDKKTEHDFCV